MAEVQKRKKGQILNHNEKQLILNLMHYLKEKNSRTSVTELVKEISKATGCSERTIYKIRKEASKGFTAITTKTRLRKRENKNSRNVKYDSYVKSSIRIKVHNYFYQNSAPTLNTILCLVNSDPDLPKFKRTTLHTFLKEIGFVYEQKGKKLLLTEKCDSVKCRQAYLKDIRRFRSENRRIVYTGETLLSLIRKEIEKNEGVVCQAVHGNTMIDPVFVSDTLNCGTVNAIIMEDPEVVAGTTLVCTIDTCNFSNTVCDTAQTLNTINIAVTQEGQAFSDSIPGNKILGDNSYLLGESSNVEREGTDRKSDCKLNQSKISRELRFTVMHAGSESGLLEGVEHVILDKKRNDMDNYEQWFIHKLLPKIPPNSVIVMDNNSSYYQKKDIPDGSWKKHQIKSWLASKNVNVTKINQKKDLLAAVNCLPSACSARQKIDELAKQRGIILVNLPPYHYELNPLNLIWAQVKCHVQSNMKTFRVKTIKKLVKEAFYTTTNVDWMNYIHHIWRMEDLLWSVDQQHGANQSVVDKS